MVPLAAAPPIDSLSKLSESEYPIGDADTVVLCHLCCAIAEDIMMTRVRTTSLPASQTSNRSYVRSYREAVVHCDTVPVEFQDGCRQTDINAICGALSANRFGNSGPGLMDRDPLRNGCHRLHPMAA